MKVWFALAMAAVWALLGDHAACAAWSAAAIVLSDKERRK